MRIGDMTPWLPGGIGDGGGNARVPGRAVDGLRTPAAEAGYRAGSAAGAEAGASAGVQPGIRAEQAQETRAERIARVRQLIESGRPVDLAKLADTLLGTGILFDERA